MKPPHRIPIGAVDEALGRTEMVKLKLLGDQSNLVPRSINSIILLRKVFKVSCAASHTIEADTSKLLRYNPGCTYHPTDIPSR